MVGAGGIGCELLKNLALAGFGEIHVLDLDTIDLSNLNRQFLFRREHIKKSKALVAKEVAQRFNPNVKIIAHHANIMDAEFNVEWFQGFNVVFGALDNVAARRHVNKMCLAADVPLIESGTTGFNGQVQVIKKGLTACYDCTAKDAPKSFPVCTIRSTPSQPIHCIVWGKSYLLSEIFGASEDESAFDTTSDRDNAKEIEELRLEAEALRKIRRSVGTENFAKDLFNKVFDKDIVRLKSMDDMWKSRRPPEPLNYEEVMKRVTELGVNPETVLQDGQKVWSLEENMVVFNDSLDRLSKRMLKLKDAQADNGPEPIITFDKDDNDTLDFVTASANIRSAVFGIERRSRFDIKQMAGNIIPAIATTNAIVAGLCVLETFKVLKGNYKQAKEVFLTPFNQGDRLLAATLPRPPNPECPVCSVYNTTVHVDLARATLHDVVEDFLKVQLGYGEKEFSVQNEVGILYDPDEEENLEKKLTDLGVKDGSFLTVVDDDDEDPFVNVVINVQTAKEPLGEKAVQGPSPDQLPTIPRRPKKAPETIATVNGYSNGVPGESSASRKRRADIVDEGEVQPAKKAKTLGSLPRAEDEVILVDDDGTIMIHDD